MRSRQVFLRRVLEVYARVPSAPPLRDMRSVNPVMKHRQIGLAQGAEGDGEADGGHDEGTKAVSACPVDASLGIILQKSRMGVCRN